LLVTIALASACGVPQQRKAELVSQDRVPDALRTDATVAAPLVPITAPVDLWFVREGHLTTVQHSISGSRDAQAVVGELLAGPTDAERQDGLRSAIPNPSAIASVALTGGVVTVDLTQEFADIPAGDQLLAVGQLVLTLTDLRGVGLVSFTLAGAPAAVPLPDGDASTGTVSRDLYTSLR
jgi:spore germination protein GerM